MLLRMLPALSLLSAISSALDSHSTHRGPPAVIDIGQEVRSLTLSERDQRILDQIQHAFDDDPSFAAKLTGRGRHRRRPFAAAAAFTLGLAALVGGVILTSAVTAPGMGLSVTGFLMMVGAAWLLGPGQKGWLLADSADRQQSARAIRWTAVRQQVQGRLRHPFDGPPS